MLKFASPVSAWTPKERTHAEWADHHRRVVVLLLALGVLCSYPAGVFTLALLTAPKPAPVAAQAISSSGVVVAMNDNTGTISIQHEAIPAFSLPAATTAFRSEPGLRKRIYIGDQLTFHMDRQGSGFAITDVKDIVPAQH